jgi:hypothetical protein
MVSELVLEKLRDEGAVEIARISQSRIVIGREASAGIVLPLEGISRRHGIFIRSDRHWLYTDLGSVNGSWHNDDRIEKDRWYILRDGDFLQLANVMLRVRLASDGMATADSLLVVNAELEVREFSIPEEGAALIVGGAESDLPVTGDSEEDPLAVVERDGRDLLAMRGRSEVSVALNGEEIGASSTLAHNDLIAVAEYQVLFSSPAGASAKPRPKWSPGKSQHPERIEGSGDTGAYSRNRLRTHGVFGQTPADDGIGATQAINPEDLRNIKSASGRSVDNLAFDEPTHRYSILEDTVILVLGVGLVGALLGIMIWWFMK